MQLRGVAIDVSFDNEERKDLKSLSGGQQSVVSLALVFSILQIDRAPFYLFDEADMVYGISIFSIYSYSIPNHTPNPFQALDCNYRSKMAELMSKFSLDSQFIVSTFSPELLQHAQRLVGVSYDQRVHVSLDRVITFVETRFNFLFHFFRPAVSWKSLGKKLPNLWILPVPASR